MAAQGLREVGSRGWVGGGAKHDLLTCLPGTVGNALRVGRSWWDPRVKRVGN